jgi:hypothetical protein
MPLTKQQSTNEDISAMAFVCANVPALAPVMQVEGDLV